MPPLTLSCTTSCPGSSVKPSGRPCVGGYLSPTPGAPTSPPTAPPVRGTWATAKCPSVAWVEGSPWRKRNRRLPRAQLNGTVENSFIFGIRTLLSCYIKIVKFTLFNPLQNVFGFFSQNFYSYSYSPYMCLYGHVCFPIFSGKGRIDVIADLHVS